MPDGFGGVGNGSAISRKNLHDIGRTSGTLGHL
jgi:hypothetical protein